MKTLIVIFWGMVIVPYLIGAYVAWDMAWPAGLGDWNALDRAKVAVVLFLLGTSATFFTLFCLDDWKKSP